MKKTKRESKKYPAVNPEVNLKSRYEEIMDINEYFGKLSEKDKEWMNQFTEEYVNASFSKKKKPLHKTKRLKKDCYDRNNSRNRDVMVKTKITNHLLYTEELLAKDDKTYYPEDDINEKIDLRKK